MSDQLTLGFKGRLSSKQSSIEVINNRYAVLLFRNVPIASFNIVSRVFQFDSGGKLYGKDRMMIIKSLRWFIEFLRFNVGFVWSLQKARITTVQKTKRVIWYLISYNTAIDYIVKRDYYFKGGVILHDGLKLYS